MSRNLYALLVGIDDYPQKGAKLEGCVNDIEAIEEYLKTRIEQPEERLHIKRLINQEATRQAVIDGFEKHLTQADKEDVVLFYYSGHGSQEPTPPEFRYLERDGKLETLVCWDSRTSARDLANKELRYLIEKVARRNPHIVIVLDSCHSGSGTKDVEQMHKVRHESAVTQPRTIEEFIFANDVEFRSQQHKEDWDLREGRHVLLAACQDQETAKEYSGDGKTRGAFSYFLLDALNKTNSPLSYREILKKVNARVRSRIKDQTPRLEATNPDDLDNLPFLGGSNIIKPREPFFTLSHNGTDWQIDGGAIHGFPTMSNISIKLALYSEDSTSEQMRQLSEAVGEAEVIEVFPDKSIVEFTQEPTNLTEDTTLRAIAISMPPPTIGVYLEGDSEALEQVRHHLQTVGPGEKPSLYIREVQELVQAQYRLLAKDGQYVIMKPSDDRPLVDSIKGYDQAFRAVKYLEHIARWTTTIHLENPESEIPADAVKVQIYHKGEEVKKPHLRLEYEYRNGKWQEPKFRVKLTNTYDQRLFCAILDVSEDYSVEVPPLFPQGELSQNGGLWIEPGEDKAVWAAIWKGNRKMRDDIPAKVPDKIWKKGVTEYQDVFKLIVSTAEFDAKLLEQENLSSPSVESSGGRRSLPSRLNTLNLLMYQIQSRQFGVVEEIDDWVTSEITFTTVRPKDAVPLNPQAPTDLSFGVTIQPHSGLRANVRLSSVPPSTRDLDSPTLPPILDDYTQPFQFTASRGVDPGLSTLDLQVDDSETIETVTPDNPWVISVNKPIAENEYILPVAYDYDEELWLPLGQGKGKDGKTEIRIERLPTPSGSEKKRSLGGAITILYRKLKCEQFGSEFPYPKLRVAQVAEDGTVHYEEDLQKVKAEVANAKRIALYIHGIIGDTESMVPSVRQAKVMVNGQSKSLAEIYDLVLTFDYESLNTPIKELGKQLRDKLAAVGLTPNHGKTLHIVAHSMGGLVSRSFIEQWQGNQVVHHLIMVGTPNAGSPWSGVQDLATFALAAGLNSLSSGVFPAKLLVSLVEWIEKIDVNLDEMHPTKSQFLQELKTCGDPQCLYSIIAGNTALIPQDQAKINRLQAALRRTKDRAIEFPFMGEAHDIAVTVKSIVSVPENRSPAAYIQDQVACHHLSYFQHPAGLDALARAVARAFPDYSGPATPPTTPHPPQPTPIAPGGNTDKGKTSSPSPQPSGNSAVAAPRQTGARSVVNSPTAQSESGFTNSYAVVIGINDYNSGVPPLRTAAKDAKVIAEILGSEEHGYTLISPPKSAKRVENGAWLDGDATLANLNELLKTLKERVDFDDRLLFYFAGHGIASNNEDGPKGYLIPQDAKCGNTNTYLPMIQLRQALAQLNCRHCLIILDCCYSGAFKWSNTRQFGHVREIYKDTFDLFINDPAWQVITSSAHDQTAADMMALENNRDFGNAEHSPFANALINALRDEAADRYPPAKDGKPSGDGIITANELHQYVLYNIELPTAQRDRRQTPGLWTIDEKHNNGQYVFLTKHFNREELPPAPKPNEQNNPYRGLESYEEEHSQLFFGRTQLIEQLCDRVCDHPLTVVLGASGSGKSSLVKAGLIPHLKRSPEEAQQLQKWVSIQDSQTHRHKHEKWNVLTPIRPGESPLTVLENALKKTNLDSIPTETKLLLVIDQFEELVTQCSDQTKREQFLQQLSELLKKYSDRFRIVLTLRLDFEPQLRDNVEAELKKHKNLLESLLNAQQPNQSEGVASKQQDEERIWNGARFIIPPMTREDLQEAIEAPAAVRAIQFDSEKRNNRTLVQQLIHEVADMPGALPLLSFALSELYRQLAHRFIDALNKGETPDRTITWADYDELGGVTTSLTRRATEEYNKLANDEQKILRWVALRMISLQGGELARRRVPESELKYPNNEDNNRVETVIQRFCDARLIVKGSNSQGESYVEPAHDALIQNWDQLQKWKNEQEENLILQRKLTPVANDWQEVNEREEAKKKQSKVSLKYLLYLLEQLEAISISKTQHKIRNLKKYRRAKQQSNDSSKNYLWHNDPRLAPLNLFLDSPDNWFNKTEDEFVRESVIHKGRNTYRFWLRVALIGAGLVLLTGWAVFEQRQAKIEEMLAWKESAEGNLKSDRDIRTFIDILQAVNISQNPLVRFFPPDTALAEVQETMYKAFYTVKERNRIESDRATFDQVSFNPKTNELVTIGDGDTIRLWDKSGNQVDQFATGQNRVYSVAFSQDGKRLATGGGNGTVKLWNLKKDGTVDYNLNSTICPIANPTNPSGTNLENPSGANLENTSGANPDNTSGTNLENPSGANLENPSGANLENPSGANLDNTSKANPTNPSGTNPTTTSETNPTNPSGANPANISGVVFSHDNKLLATLIEGRDAQNNLTTTVNLWDIKQGNCIPRNIANTPLGQEGQPPNNQQTATHQKNQLIVPTPNNQPTVPIKDIAFSPNENLIATVAQNNTIRLWDISGKKLGEFPTDQRNVYSLAFTPDGKLATSGDEGTVKLWTIQNNGIKATLSSQVPEEIKTEQTILYDIAFSEGNKWLATIGEDSAIRLHDRSQQSFIKRIFNQHIVEIPPIEASNQTITATSAVFSPDGKTMATIAGDNTVKLWNNLGQQIARFNTDAGDIKSIAFSPEGNLWLTSGDNSEISIRDTSGEEIDKISLQNIPACDQQDDTIASANNMDENTESSPNPITQVVFAFIDTNDGTEPDQENWRYNQLEDDEYAGMMTIFEDGTTRFLSFQGEDLQDTSSSEYCTEPFPKDLGLIKGLASSPDGEHLVTIGKDDDTINLWDEASDQFQQLPIPKTDNETFTSVAFSPDEKRLAIASASAAEDETGLVRIWDITQNAIVEQFDTGQGELYSVAFSPLDSRQLVTGGGDGTVKVWDISSNRPAQFSTTQGTIQRMEFSPNQELLATINKNNQLNLWNVREDGTVSLNPAAEIVQQQYGGVKNVTFSPDSKTLILVGNDDTIKLWNMSNNQLDSFVTQQQQIQSLAASPNKRKLATIGSNGILKLWQIQDGNLSPIDISKSQVSQSQINSLAFSPDGKQLATAQGNILKLWTVSSGKLSNQSVDQFQTQQPIQSVAFSPNRKKVATSENQGMLKLWDIKGNLLDQIPTQQVSITRLVFSPNSNIIATIGQDGTLKLWDTSDKSEAKLSLISTHPAQGVANVAFSQDGKFLAIGRNNGSIELRQLGDVDALKAEICNTIGDYFQNNPDRQLCGGIAVSTQRILSRGGDKLLVPSITNPDKQAGVQGIAAGAFPTAIGELTTSLEENRNDPEALIYLNNARIGTQKSYTIAVSVPLGNTVHHGLEVLRGVAQAQDEINREGGINGVFLRVLIANDNNDAKVGKQIAQELSKNPDVLGVVGHFASDVTLAAGKVYQAHKLAAISPVSTSTQWFKSHWYSDQYMFRTAPDDNTTATTLADSMLNKLQEKNAVVFYNSQSQYSQSLKLAFSDAVGSAGGQVLQEFDLSDLNFDAQQTVQESTQQGAKVLVLLLDREELDKAIEIIKQKRGNQMILGGDAFYGTKLLEVAQEEENVKDMMIAVPWHISNSQSNFAETSRKLWWADVSWRTALSYDATQALIAALKQNPTRQGVAEILRSESFSVDGATGKVQFLPSGDRTNQLTNPLSQLVTIEPGSRSGYGYDFVAVP